MCSCWEAHLKCDCTPTVLKHGLHPVCVCLEICVRSSLLGRHSESKTWRWNSGILQCYLKSCDMGDWDWHIFTIFPGGSDGKESAYQCRRCQRCWFYPWVGKIPWRRALQPPPVFLPGESHGQRSLAGYSPWSGRVRHDWVTEHDKNNPEYAHEGLQRWPKILDITC